MNIPSNLLKAITQNNSFIAHAHLGPDADSIGSTLALKLGLESIGKVVTIYCEDEIPDFANFLPQINTFEIGSMREIFASNPADVYLSLDSAAWKLVTHDLPIPDLRLPLINIDHHPSNQLSRDLSWIDPQSSSTAEMVFHLLNELEINITSEIATCLLFGILGDTGAFQNLNTDGNSLRVAALLIDKGASYSHCVVELTRSHPFADLQVWSRLLKNLQISTDGSFVYTSLSSQDIEELGHSPQIGLFANSIIGKVKGTKFGAVLIEKKPNSVKGAIRARSTETDVSQIAALINGGGHPGAAGFKIEKPLKDAITDFLNAVEHLQKQGKI